MKEYLNEDRLEVILSKLFPNDEIIRNKQIPNSGRRFRPDFRIENKKLIIEFDGYQHYTLSKNVL